MIYLSDYHSKAVCKGFLIQDRLLKVAHRLESRFSYLLKATVNLIPAVVQTWHRRL